jgi:hypothetical protein
VFLNKEELRTLTGYVRAADQIRWLESQKLPHFVNKGGAPIVLRSAIEVMLAPVGHESEATTEPNWSALGV